MRVKSIFFFFALLFFLSCSEQSPNECGPIPNGSALQKVRIIQVLPNPVGTADDGESFTLKNFDSKSMSLSGWRILNSSKTEWSLSSIGVLEPCENRTFVTRNDGAMSNDIDTLWLFDNGNNLIQTVWWTDAADGEVVKPQ